MNGRKCLCLVVMIGVLFSFGCVTATNMGKMTRSDSSASAAAAPKDIPNERTFSSAVTIKHPEKNFRYTIPQGWRVVLDEENRDSSVVANVPTRNPMFAKGGSNGISTCVFGMTIEPMVASFPRGHAVAAGLKQDKERISIKQVKEAKRRDQSDPKKKCSFIGWQTYEAERPDPTYNRSIFYRGYDQSNVMYTFGAVCQDQFFAECQDELLSIIESIDFCVE